MSDIISKIPFFRLLLPAIGAIAFSAHVAEIPFPAIICVVGAVVVGLSFLISEKRQFSYRWLFGAGISLFIFGLFGMLYQFRSAQTDFIFPEQPITCIGVVTDIPQEKARSFACNLKTTHPVEKNIVVYLQKDDQAAQLQPGNEIVFSAKVQPFKNFGNPDDFDYAQFMRNKGFSGSAYLSATNWKTTGRTELSLHVIAQRVRQSVLRFYKQFELDNDAYSFISALTIGYKQELSNEVKEAFRASGTSHVLAVSGLHVGIIYAILIYVFSFMGRIGKRYKIQQALIIIALWAFAFLAGFSPSVVRAAIMLSVACFAIASGKKGFTYNTLAIAAFFILTFNSFALFDVGFQMSFAAVLAILYFNPPLNRLLQPKTKIGKYFWGLFTVSIAAQIGVFPVTLYYFGSFPTYFLVANLLVVPLILIIICACIPMIIIVLLKQLDVALFDWTFRVFGWIFKSLINIALHIVYFIESLPFAQFTDRYISVFQMILLIIITISTFRFFVKRQAAHLIWILSCILLFSSSLIYEKLSPETDKLMIFNTPNASDIGLYINKKRSYFDLPKNGFIPHSEKVILRLSENYFRQAESAKPFQADVLILSDDKSFSMRELSRVFSVKQLVLDSSVPPFTRNSLIKQCQTLQIPVHDVSQDGAYSINL